MNDVASSVSKHYARADLGRAILDALAGMGKDVDALTIDDLAPVDEFHIRGREASAELARRVRLGAADRVLDVGCGIGGPARYLASTFGCHVTGLDLTEDYVRLARTLAARTGLAAQTRFVSGDALDLPFDDDAFDVVWTQHAAMNIAEKDRLYAEMARVLAPAGRLALYDVGAGRGGAPIYPVPWADDASISFLIEPDALRAKLEGLGLAATHWADVSAAALEWFRARLAALEAEGPAPLGVHLVIGPDFAVKFANLRNNLEQGRVAVVEAAFARPDRARPSG